MWIYTGNKSAKFHGNIFILSENIARSFREGLLFLTHTVHTYKQTDRTEIIYHAASRMHQKSVHASLTSSSGFVLCTFYVDCKRKVVSSHFFPCLTFNHPRVESSSLVASRTIFLRCSRSLLPSVNDSPVHILMFSCQVVRALPPLLFLS